MPAKAGIQKTIDIPDSRFRGNDIIVKLLLKHYTGRLMKKA
jgi:hypothetical protein